MKTTIVPAQVTTVEDKIAGNLGATQLLLLVAPIFIGGGIYIILPPFSALATYKLVLTTILAALFCILSIRIKGRVMLLWAALLMQYNLRPRYHVFDKNDLHLRDADELDAPEDSEEENEKLEEVVPVPLPSLSVSDLVKLESLMNHPKANFRFKTNRKGELSVHFTEVE